MSKNVCLNMVRATLQNLIETTLYKDLNVTIHHQWENLFALHLNLKYQILIYNDASSNNSDFDNK
jgi:hypothetical protein